MSHPLVTAPIGRSLLRLAGPTTGLMLVQILVAAVDVYFIGRLGIDVPEDEAGEPAIIDESPEDGQAWPPDGYLLPHRGSMRTTD